MVNLDKVTILKAKVARLKAEVIKLKANIKVYARNVRYPEKTLDLSRKGTLTLTFSSTKKREPTPKWKSVADSFINAAPIAKE